MPVAQEWYNGFHRRRWAKYGDIEAHLGYIALKSNKAYGATARAANDLDRLAPDTQRCRSVRFAFGVVRGRPAMGVVLRRNAFLKAVTFCALAAPLSFAAGQAKTSLFAPPDSAPSRSQTDQVVIPGPLRSFLRMAGISQKIPPEDVLPELARSVYSLGFNHSGGQLHETEFLVLLRRYLRQARELQALAGPTSEIRVDHCADAGPLLKILGYHLKGACGQKDATLTPLNPDNAFLTVDSGFPLTQLEQSMQADTPFVYPYAPSRVPVLLKTTDWTNLNTSRQFPKGDLLELLMHDQQIANLYWAFSRIDPETTGVLQRSIGLTALLPYANVLDFYGTELCVRSRRVLVPGGAAAEPAWKDLVGASPGSPGDFLLQLLKQDRGWMALYFDTVARVDKAQQARLVQGQRLRRLYEAFIGPGVKDWASGASFRKAPGLLLLFTRQQWLPDGQPRIPGNVDLWKTVLGKHGRRVGNSEQVLQAMAAASRQDTDDGPLQIYLSLGEVEAARSPQRSLAPATLLPMANSYARLGDWYSIFTEFPELNDSAILRFIRTAESLDRISNPELRGDALGIFQANIGLWQIMARQGEIPAGQIDASWQKVVDAFYRFESGPQLFLAGEKSVDQLMLAASGRENLSQNELIELLAGPPQKNSKGKKVRGQVAEEIRSVMEDQRLTSLETILELGRGLDAVAHGSDQKERLLGLASELREFEMPRRIFTESEKIEWAPGVLSQRHAELEVHTDLVKTIKESNSPEKLEAARGQLAPFLRDTLVGLNYAYYEPPGSQILHINPLFVRSHDFAATTIVGDDQVWRASTLFGTGVSAGGGAYLVGSLADLPYVLSSTEQNFISPQNVQALIWQELVPSLMASSTLARWWNVTPRELHAVALYQRSGEEILLASASDQQLRDKVVAILADRLPPVPLERLKTSLQQKDSTKAIARLMPADTFYLAAEFRTQSWPGNTSWGPSSRELDELLLQKPADVTLKRISRDFGIPHPILAQTYGREIVNGKPFPAFSGYCNRLFGESWDSDNLYWARLADEMNESPEMLNILSPQLTRLMISKIFATDIEDWSAVVRALHETGDEMLQGRVASAPSTETAAKR